MRGLFFLAALLPREHVQHSTADIESRQQPRESFEEARQKMADAIREDVRRRIGGDRQRIDKIQTRHDAITFKHLLLPVWMLAYRYNDKSFRVFVNAATGEVQGERPYSWVKITLLVLTIAAAIGTIWLLTQS